MLEFSDSGLTLGMFRRYARARSILGCLSMSWTCFSSLARKAVISLRREDNSTSGEMAGEASQAKEVHAPLVERMKQISRKSHKYELRHCNPLFYTFDKISGFSIFLCLQNSAREILCCSDHL